VNPVDTNPNDAPVNPVAAVPALNTYAGIKYARKNKVMPTPEQFEQALLAQRQLVADLAVAAAVASGESYTQHKLPFPVETNGIPSYELSGKAGKESRHLSKLVYWFAKFQAGKFHEDLPYQGGHSAIHGPEDDYDPSEDEDYEGESGED
jgi:hypothetical protein